MTENKKKKIKYSVCGLLAGAGMTLGFVAKPFIMLKVLAALAATIAVITIVYKIINWQRD